jgi:hypothetical protein
MHASRWEVVDSTKEVFNLKFAPIVRAESHYETSCSFHQEDNEYPLNELCLGILATGLCGSTGG